MARYINLDDLIKYIKENGYVYASTLENWPSYDIKDEQVFWERDLAILQLRNDYGVGLGEKKNPDCEFVVRCKDCKWFVYDMDLNHETYPNEIEADGICQITEKYCDMPHFCSYGERREENEI